MTDTSWAEPRFQPRGAPWYCRIAESSAGSQSPAAARARVLPAAPTANPQSTHGGLGPSATSYMEGLRWGLHAAN